MRYIRNGNVTTEPLSGSPERFVRVRIRDEHSELTCLNTELPDILTWAEAHRGNTRAAALPVPEYKTPGWDSTYRWTMAAYEPIFGTIPVNIPDSEP